MKKVLLDTNIIIDLIADRKPFSKYSIEIFKKLKKRKLNYLHLLILSQQLIIY